MTRVFLMAAAVVALGFVSSAVADDAVTASLSKAVPHDVSVIAGEGAWNCSGATCVLQSDPSDVSKYEACRDLRRQLGVDITQLGSGQHQLGADLLANCNK